MTRRRPLTDRPLDEAGDVLGDRVRLVRAGVHDHVGHLAVQRLAVVLHLAERGGGIVVEQRPVLAVADPVDEHVGVGAQPHDVGIGVTQGARGSPR